MNWGNFCIAVFVAICAAILFLLWDANQNCTNAGGVYVRTLFGATCIGAKP